LQKFNRLLHYNRWGWALALSVSGRRTHLNTPSFGNGSTPLMSLLDSVVIDSSGKYSVTWKYQTLPSGVLYSN